MKYFDSTIQQYFNEVLATGKCRTKEKKMEELFRAMTALEESLLGNASHYLTKMNKHEQRTCRWVRKALK